MKNNRRLRVRVRIRVRLILFYSELGPTDSYATCSKLYLDGKNMASKCQTNILQQQPPRGVLSKRCSENSRIPFFKNISGWLLLNLLKVSSFSPRLLTKTYLESCQTSTMDAFSKNIFRLKAVGYFREKVPSQMFDRILDTSLTNPNILENLSIFLLPCFKYKCKNMWTTT